MDYDTCAKLYFKCKAEVTEIEQEAKSRAAPIKEKMATLLQWMEAKAMADKLKNVPTPHGTGFWTTHASATVSEPGVFKDFVVQNNAWDLLETRASKLAVESHIKAYGEPPPGVSFSRVSVFALRAAGEK